HRQARRGGEAGPQGRRGALRARNRLSRGQEVRRRRAHHEEGDAAQTGALALEGKGELKQAEELFIRARETDPNNLRVRLDFGGFYDRKKIPVLAAPEYAQAIQLDPKNPETHYRYGMALVGMNEF